MTQWKEAKQVPPLLWGRAGHRGNTVPVVHVEAQSLSQGPSLSSPEGCSPPGSSVHGILQARIPEWVTISSSSPLHERESRSVVSNSL